MMPDDDAVDVAAQHRAIPDAGVIAEFNIAKDAGGFGDIDAFAQLGGFAEERVELLFVFTHLLVLPVRCGLEIKNPPRTNSRRATLTQAPPGA